MLKSVVLSGLVKREASMRLCFSSDDMRSRSRKPCSEPTENAVNQRARRRLRALVTSSTHLSREALLSCAEGNQGYHAAALVNAGTFVADLYALNKRSYVTVLHQ